VFVCFGLIYVWFLYVSITNKFVLLGLYLKKLTICQLVYKRTLNRYSRISHMDEYNTK